MSDFPEEVSGDDPSELLHCGTISRVTGWHIHWKLSARKGEWYVKEFGRPVGTAVLLLLEPVWKEGGCRRDQQVSANSGITCKKSFGCGDATM